MRVLFGVIIVIGLSTAGYYHPEIGKVLPALLFNTSQANAPRYVLAPVDHGNITKTVTATGTLSAITTVLLSSQVSGQMLRILADYNAEVTKGDVIAELDPRSFEIRVEQARNELAVAEASVAIQKNLHAKAAADLASAKSMVEGAGFVTGREQIAVAEAKRDMERKRSLTASGNVSQVEFLKAQALHDTAMQALKGAETDERTKGLMVQAAHFALRAVAAQIVHSTAVVEHRRSALEAAQVDLERTKIRSPINGVVIGRTIEEGQMIGVSLQTQTLFTVAQDLKDMQIKISVDEADIGKIKEGQIVVYTVDSYPGREFYGQIKQIRKDPQEKQNVVTYVVIATASNPDKILLPGMTANARIVIDERRDVQKVPVAALRFSPTGSVQANHSFVWTLGDDQSPKSVPVKIGLSDGKMAEVISAVPVERVIIGIDQSAPVRKEAKHIIGSM